MANVDISTALFVKRLTWYFRDKQWATNYAEATVQNCVQEVRKKGRTEETNERTNERTKGVNESVKYWMSEWRNEFFFSRPLVHLADCERYCVLLYHLSGASFRCQNRTHNSDWVSVLSWVAEVSVYGGGCHLSKDFTESAMWKGYV